MECVDYRRSVLADPRAGWPELRAHLATCHDCGEFTARLLRFESRLDRALRVDVPSHGSVEHRNLDRRRNWVALAASVLLAVVVGGGLWLVDPDSTLAADVINHMAEEPQAWTQTEVSVAQPVLDNVLRESHLRLDRDAGLVSYANGCLFRGHTVPHLVVQTDDGPVTVMVLTHEAVRSAVHFDEEGYRGMLVPMQGHGSLAVLERTSSKDSTSLDQIAARVRAAIEWTS